MGRHAAFAYGYRLKDLGQTMTDVILYCPADQYDGQQDADGWGDQQGETGHQGVDPVRTTGSR